MNASEHSDVLRGTDPVKEHRGNPGVDTLPPEFCPREQPPWDPVGPSDEGAFETFVDGAGI